MVYDPICDPLLRLEHSRFSAMATIARKKTDKKPHLALAVFLCLSFLSACGGGTLGPGFGKSPSVTLQSIQISPSAASISLGQNQQFTATGHYSDGSSKDITDSVTWASSNTGVATISGSGLATSHATGSATITASSGNISATATLTVTATKVVLVSIVVTPADAVLLLGTLQQYTATGTFSDGSQQDITDSVTWSSSNDSVVSIAAGGLATAPALGSVTISATSGS